MSLYMKSVIIVIINQLHIFTPSSQARESLPLCLKCFALYLMIVMINIELKVLIIWWLWDVENK